ncbi:hypothetical protein GmHk_19G053881 [Glycine max]|nr:hypothetical protein GmHk_19G053881 [Glycine max]
MEPTIEELINKTQLSSKIIQRHHVGSVVSQKNLTSCTLLLSFCSHEQRFAIITGTNHTIQNCEE